MAHPGWPGTVLGLSDSSWCVSLALSIPPNGDGLHIPMKCGIEAPWSALMTGVGPSILPSAVQKKGDYGTVLAVTELWQEETRPPTTRQVLGSAQPPPGKQDSAHVMFFWEDKHKDSKHPPISPSLPSFYCPA